MTRPEREPDDVVPVMHGLPVRLLDTIKDADDIEHATFKKYRGSGGGRLKVWYARGAA